MTHYSMKKHWRRAAWLPSPYRFRLSPNRWRTYVICSPVNRFLFLANLSSLRRPQFARKFVIQPDIRIRGADHPLTNLRGGGKESLRLLPPGNDPFSFIGYGACQIGFPFLSVKTTAGSASPPMPIAARVTPFESAKFKDGPDAVTPSPTKGTCLAL